MAYFRAFWIQGARTLAHMSAFTVASPAVQAIGVGEDEGGQRWAGLPDVQERHSLRTALFNAASEADVRTVLAAPISTSILGVITGLNVADWNAQLAKEPSGVGPALSLTWSPGQVGP